MSEFPDVLIEQAALAVADTQKPCRKAIAADPSEGCWLETGDCYCIRAARAVLEAVAPAIRAQALRDASESPECRTQRDYEWLNERADRIEEEGQ